MKFYHWLFSIMVLLIFNSKAHSQEDSANLSFAQLPTKFLEQVSSKANSLEQKLDKKSAKALEQFAKQEAKIKRKLSKIDLIAAINIFGNVQEKYKQLEQKLQRPQKLVQYIPYLDTLKTTFKFLAQNQKLAGDAKDVQEKFKETLDKVNGLENQLQKSEEIKRFLKERKEFLKAQLSKFGFAKQLKRLNKQAYYYSQQVNEYKSMLHDSKKAEQKALELLSKTKLFQDFMKKNSMLAGLFRIPGNPDDALAQANITGLQTRAQVNQLVQQQISAGGPGAAAQVRQNIQQAQGQLSQLKTKISQVGGGSGDIDMPDFKPNTQKTKSILKRFEYGANIQSQKATSFFPITSDIGLSLGYKLNDKGIIGIGAAYKLGWGSGWKDIKISHQGVGVRSFIDWKLKKSFYLSGGYEQNYKSEFRNIDQLQDYSAWQTSGLLGISKKYKVSKKVKGNMQVLWDFLSARQIPRTQPVVFRIGYGLK